jgi:hypothetical protein
MVPLSANAADAAAEEMTKFRRLKAVMFFPWKVRFCFLSGYRAATNCQTQGSPTFA